MWRRSGLFLSAWMPRASKAAQRASTGFSLLEGSTGLQICAAERSRVEMCLGRLTRRAPLLLVVSGASRRAVLWLQGASPPIGWVRENWIKQRCADAPFLVLRWPRRTLRLS
ncbi:hypothetical protein NDU88_002293 [Pleurodeles waltl]|uniref:Secreted protein n=1 Tax=Pleurodeles waltl TaxID=8319 RepID=A0AAV7WPG3_PLEWA|nr:hypothetical protein NDU88_002293 [Pleurodeles waltl]